MAIDREYVVWAYRLFLNREPESEEVVKQKSLAYNTVEELRRDFASSPEFHEGVLSVQSFDVTNIVIKELSVGVRLFVDLADTFIGLKVVEETYERHERRFIEQTLRPGDVAIDVGSNIGYFAVLMASRVGAEGHIYAFEPLPRNSAMLARSVEENRFCQCVTLHEAAVGAEDGKMELISPTASLNWGGAYLRTGDTPVPRYHESIVVPVVALDDLELRRPVSFIKLDAEGAELLAIRGARRLLIEDAPIVLAEINPQQLKSVSNATATEFIAEMAQHGYACHLLAVDGPAEETIRYETDVVSNVVFRSKVRADRRV